MTFFTDRKSESTLSELYSGKICSIHYYTVYAVADNSSNTFDIKQLSCFDTNPLDSCPATLSE